MLIIERELKTINVKIGNYKKRAILTNCLVLSNRIGNCSNIRIIAF